VFQACVANSYGGFSVWYYFDLEGSAEMSTAAERMQRFVYVQDEYFKA
jgi:hypothetical protein